MVHKHTTEMYLRITIGTLKPFKTNKQKTKQLFGLNIALLDCIQGKSSCTFFLFLSLLQKAEGMIVNYLGKTRDNGISIFACSHLCLVHI